MLTKLRFPASIFWDLDGTLFHISTEARRCYDNRDWDGAVDIQLRAPAIKSMVTLARSMALDHNNIIVTARDEKHREDTMRQLGHNQIPYDQLFMRPFGNLDPSPVLKMKIYNDYINALDIESIGRHVSLIIEDREDIVNAFTAKGVPALLYKGI